MFNLKDRLYHLFLLPLFFVVKHLFAIVTSADRSYTAEVFNFMAALALCSVISIGFYLLFKTRLQKINAALLASLMFIFIFFFQDIFMFMSDVHTGNVRIRWMIPLGIVATLVIGVIIYRSKHQLARINEYLNLVSLALIGYLVFTLVVSYQLLKPGRIRYDVPAYKKTCTDCPDIYFFLLDSYTSNESLKTYFNFDNAKFVKKLSSQGFAVKQQEFTRYPNTVPSLASTFNLDVDSLENYYKGDLLQMTKTSITARSLQSWGYDFYNYSLFDVLDKSRFYSITFELKPHFVNMVFQNTVLHWIFEYLGTDSNIYSIHQEILSNTAKIATGHKEHPVFVYSHILAPHPPFVIDSLGNSIPFTEQKGKYDKGAYVDTIKGLNTMLTGVVEKILTHSPNAIIVIQGDHGFRMLPEDGREQEARTVFFAYRGPASNDVNNMKNSHEIFSIILGSLGTR